ncbi:MAG: ABC transporter ATP-binding protein, partial [Thermoplasmata archaeon]
MGRAVRMVDIHKVYPDGTIALKGVDFEADFGEIHGLLGENGAGKTTLMRILYGELQPTKGEIYIEGKKTRFRGPWEALESGLAMVHQHFTLVESFTVFENLMLIAKKDETPESLRRRVEELERELNLPIPLDATVEGLPVGVQQRVEIIKTLLREARILILDEPTSVLTPLETKELFALLKKLRDMGMCIIFISHKLKEVMEITDRVTVLRKGLKVDTVRTEDVDERTLATMMVGRELAGIGERKGTRPGEALLKVEDLWVLGDRGQWAVKGVSLEVRRGEILGLAGVEGNGQMELIEAITGL